MHVLVTGHTGFKGAWLTLLLRHRGHDVSGIALDPEPGSLFERAAISGDLIADHRIDIRDANATHDAISASGADVVIHMAAQPLVRESYRDPRYTYETNVNGTLNVLEALGGIPTLGAALVVTTDKVYRNDGRATGYREDDALGGIDPYSTSKAMADLLTQSWARTSGTPIAIARAGNVIGGGDVCAERLLPDLVAAYEAGTAAQLRNPSAVRPWQHVLDCLDGYLTIVDALLAGGGSGAWNVGPRQAAHITVGRVASRFARGLDAPSWQQVPGDHLQESHMLTLDCTRLRDELSWKPCLDVDEAVDWTSEWHHAVHNATQSPRSASEMQVARYDEGRPS